MELIRFEEVVVLVRGEALTRHLGQRMICVTQLISSNFIEHSCPRGHGPREARVGDVY